LLAGGNLVDPREHAGGGGFAMGAGDDEGFVALNKLVVNDACQRGEGDAAVEHGLDFGVAAGDGVADDDEMGGGFEVGFGKRLGDGDAERAQEVGHGRVSGLVRAGDAVTAELEQSGEGGHGGAADSDEMDVFFIRHDGGG